jgi:NAD(P)-dependent dehydrogenase (short-subunit alcohol dehydrogenase family)
MTSFWRDQRRNALGTTLPLARDLASPGVRVSSIAPALIGSPSYGSGEKADAFKPSLAACVLFPHRLGLPEEMASVILEALTNDYMNTAIIRLDGGIRLPPK